MHDVVVIMKKRILIILLFVCMFIPNGVKAEDYDCYYEVTSSNKKTSFGYNIGEEIKVIEFKGKIINQIAKTNKSDNDYTTDKCYDYAAVSVKEKKQHSGYEIEYKLGNSADEVNLGSGSGVASVKRKADSESNSANNNSSKSGQDASLDVTPVDICKKGTTSLKVFQVIGYILMLIKIIVPLILIILGSIDFGKASLSGDDKAVKDAASQFAKRIIIGLVVFFVPTVLDFFLSLINGVSDTTTKFDNCTNCIFSPTNESKCSPGNLTDNNE